MNLIDTVAKISTTGLNENILAKIFAEARVSFSQYGEDCIVAGMLGHRFKSPGFYLDLGACHPVRFSNTYMLYVMGWRGVNIEGNPDALAFFRELRPHDRTECCVVGPKTGSGKFYSFEEPAYNRFFYDEVTMLPPSPVIRVDQVTCRGVNELLSELVPDNERFDFLNTDLEGLDWELLQAIDFKRFRPAIIATEIDPETWGKAEFRSFISSLGYQMVAHCSPTVILADMSKLTV